MNFFFDNNLSPKLAKAIHILVETDGHSVIHLRDKFKPDTSDIDWISGLSAENWVIISGDLRITKNPHEKKAWLESGLTAFFLTKSWMNLPRWDICWQLMKKWPAIVNQAEIIQPGAGFEVHIKGKIKQLIIK